jgi:hypothetical protein
MEDAKIAELKQKHGNDLIMVTAPDGTEVVFRPPQRLEYDQWYDKRNDGSAPARQLAQSCLVYPDRAAMAAVLDRYPYVLQGKDGFIDVITDLAGADGGVTAKKL